MYERPLWIKAGQFGWIRNDDAGLEIEDVSEDNFGRDNYTFYLTKDGAKHGPFTSICVSGSQPGWQLN